MEPKFHFFSDINNIDKKIDLKVKYFFDCFAIATSFTGVHYMFKNENHRTLVNSIIYQIENGHIGFKRKYISKYLNNELFSENEIGRAHV